MSGEGGGGGEGCEMWTVLTFEMSEASSRKSRRKSSEDRTEGSGIRGGGEGGSRGGVVSRTIKSGLSICVCVLKRLERREFILGVAVLEQTRGGIAPYLI